MILFRTGEADGEGKGSSSTQGRIETTGRGDEERAATEAKEKGADWYQYVLVRRDRTRRRGLLI